MDRRLSKAVRSYVHPANLVVEIKNLLKYDSYYMNHWRFFSLSLTTVKFCKINEMQNGRHKRRSNHFFEFLAQREIVKENEFIQFINQLAFYRSAVLRETRTRIYGRDRTS